MWFKQVSFYPISKEKLPDFEYLSNKLAQSEFSPCQGLDWFSEGFSSPVHYMESSPQKRRKSSACRRDSRYFGRKDFGNSK